ncbi:MAG: hypothetical protein L0228_22195 [Planctomycetes bacterium]|nr:hypothetical protein [Planctomycetota bacterium]
MAANQPSNERVIVADSCRRLADKVAGVIEAVRSSFESSDPRVRASRVMHYTNEMVSDAAPFFSWLERTQPVEKARQEQGRLLKLCDEAIACTGEGQQRRLAESVSYVAHFVLHLKMWADQIEALETQPKACSDLVEKRWRREAGGFWFDDRFYELTGKPLALLRVFLESPRRQTFGYADLRAAWEDDLAENATIRAALSDLRTLLRTVASDASIECDDPLPGNQGSWRFALPR